MLHGSQVFSKENIRESGVDDDPIGLEDYEHLGRDVLDNFLIFGDD